VLHVSAHWVFQNLSARDRHWRVALSQKLLGSYTVQVTKNCFVCHRLVTGDKTWIYHLPSKLEFMQWKDVDRPTFTRICNSAIN